MRRADPITSSAFISTGPVREIDGCRQRQVLVMIARSRNPDHLINVLIGAAVGRVLGTITERIAGERTSGGCQERRPRQAGQVLVGPRRAVPKELVLVLVCGQIV